MSLMKLPAELEAGYALVKRGYADKRMGQSRSLEEPGQVNQPRPFDFMCTTLTDSLSFRTSNTLRDCYRERPGITVDSCPPRSRITLELDQFIKLRVGLP